MKYVKPIKYVKCIRCGKKFVDDSDIALQKRSKARRNDEVSNYSVCPECLERL